MMHNLKVHTIILKLLKDGSYVLEEIGEKDEGNKVIVQIFEACYEFLLKFCKNDNKENKKCLYRDLNIFVQHLEFYEVGQTTLVNEIFKNNYKLSVQVSEDLILAYFSKITSATKKGGHNPKYLDFFDNIIWDKNELIKENCSKIVNVIFDSNKKYNFLFMKENPFLGMREEEVSEDLKAKKFRSFGHHIFSLELNFSSSTEDIPFIYHARALRILYDCLQASDDKQMLKFICQKTLNLSYMFELLSHVDIYYEDSPKALLYTILEIELMRIIDDVWLTSDKPPSSIFNNIYVCKFLQKQTKNLRNLKREDIENIKTSRKSKVASNLTRRSKIQRLMQSHTISERTKEDDEEEQQQNTEEIEEEEEKEDDDGDDDGDESDDLIKVFF